MTTIEIQAERVETLHEIQDESKYSALVASMEDSGWTGAPIVVIERDDADPLAITGSHRIPAAGFVGIDIPAVTLRDLFDAADLDYDATFAEYLDAGFDLYDAMVRAIDELPAEVRDHYGLDAH